MTAPTLATCHACGRTFTTTRAAQQHARGRGHMVLLDDASTTTNNTTTEENQ